MSSQKDDRRHAGLEAERDGSPQEEAKAISASDLSCNYSIHAGDRAVSSAKDARVSVMLDTELFTAKPRNQEIAVLTRRMQSANPRLCSYSEFCDHVKRGGSWVGGCYKPAGDKWGAFKGQQLFALDFDNCAETRHGNDEITKHPLAPGEPGFLDPVDALDRCESLGLNPLCLYFTFSAISPSWPRYRIVFDMEELLDEDMAKAVSESLLAAFPEADQQCRNANRLWFGSNGEVWETWRCWGDS